MNSIDIQKTYWDDLAGKKTFTHQINMNEFQMLVSENDSILDYGCGYGRICNELFNSGYNNVIGIDISPKMVAYGKTLYPDLELLHFDGESIPYPDDTFAACTLMAVLTCIPTDEGQNQVIKEIYRVLRPNGILYISDYPIQNDSRNLERYQQYEKDFGTYGVFRLADGGIVRHHDIRWIYELLSDFSIIMEDKISVSTMNGNHAEIFQIMAKKN